MTDIGLGNLSRRETRFAVSLAVFTLLFVGLFSLLAGCDGTRRPGCVETAEAIVHDSRGWIRSLVPEGVPMTKGSADVLMDALLERERRLDECLVGMREFGSDLKYVLVVASAKDLLRAEIDGFAEVVKDIGKPEVCRESER